MAIASVLETERVLTVPWGFESPPLRQSSQESSRNSNDVQKYIIMSI